MKVKPTGYDRKKDGSDEYKKYIRNAIEKLTKDGFSFPLVKKITGPGKVFQLRGHEWIWDELQGYWERHNKIYKHRSRVDYRALYIGTIILLMEEEALSERDNSMAICDLEAYCELRKSHHAILRKMAISRLEIIELLKEVDNKIINPEEFDRDCQVLINTIPEGDYRNDFARKVDEMIEDESRKLKNRKYQAKHRYFEKIAKGMQIVEG